mmetsp:Transcript_16372/g.31123  ORF Transcript_16372/g.31123 Transcript_16372/m.31123 type:complete len:239 (-) Transcript_16372:79-795(-)
MKSLSSSSSQPQPLQNLQSKTSHVLAKTATWMEHFFLCCTAPKDAVNDDAMDYCSLPSDGEYDTTKTTHFDPNRQRKSGKDDVSDRAIARTKSFFNQNSQRRGRNSTRSDGSIVFLDAMEPHVRPVLHLPASASSIRTATTASMSSSIPGAFSFDNEEDCCDSNSMVTTTSVSSAATTQVTRPRSFSSATTAKFRTNSMRRRRDDDNEYRDEQHSIRQVQTEVLPYLPTLSATDGYRC